MLNTVEVERSVAAAAIRANHMQIQITGEITRGAVFDYITKHIYRHKCVHAHVQSISSSSCVWGGLGTRTHTVAHTNDAHRCTYIICKQVRTPPQMICSHGVCAMCVHYCMVYAQRASNMYSGIRMLLIVQVRRHRRRQCTRDWRRWRRWLGLRLRVQRALHDL